MKGWMKALLWIAGILGLAFGILRIWFIEFHRVPQDVNDPRNWSNAPNLEPGDYAVVWRTGTPHVGELVRCVDPNDQTRWLVGRVIALGGEKIEINDGVITLNNFRLRLSGCLGPPRKTTSPEGVEVDIPCQGEELGASKHDVYVGGTAVQMPPFVVEAGKMFLLSDNRADPYANDSRTLGAFPVEACHQQLVMRLWSKKGWGDSERRLSFLF